MTGWRVTLSALYAGVAAVLVVNVLPALVNILGMELKWDDRILGLFASADVAGITLGSLLGVPVVRRFDLRTVVFAGVVALVAADLACAMSGTVALIVSYRFIGGAASGMILAACYAVYSHSHAQRNFGAFQAGQMISGFVGVTALPLLASSFSWRSSFYALAGLTALALPLSMGLPARPYVKTTVAHPGAERPRGTIAVWVAVGGMVAYILGQGAVWTFMARIGMNSGLSTHDVDVALSACTLGGLLGSVATMFPSERLGVVAPLTACAVLSIGALSVVQSPNAAVFIASLSAFMFAWPAFASLQFAAIAAADTVGTATISMSAANYAGFAIGPYLGGELVVRYGFETVQYLGMGGVLLALISLLPLCLGRRARLSNPTSL